MMIQDLHELLHLPGSLIRDLHFVSRTGRRSKEPLIDHLVQKFLSSKTTSSVHFITGPAGSGKSTFANQLFKIWIASSLSGMLLTLNNIDDIQKLQTLSPESLLILDALNEYTDDEKVVEGIVDRYGSSCNLVICCRPTVIPSTFSSYIVQLDLFNSQDIATYISTFAKEFQMGSIELMASKEEIQELKSCSNLGSFVSSFISQDGDYPSLLRNPLVLALFMVTLPKIFSNMSSAEVISEAKCNNRVAIMDNFISSWFYYYAKKRPCTVDIDNVVKFMHTYCQNAAQYFMTEGKLSEHFVKLGKDKESALLSSDMDPQLQKIYQSLSSTDDLLQVVKSGALVHENKGHFRFFHDAILEYFFSKELYVGVLGEINARLNGIHLNKKFIKNVEILNLLADMVNLDPNFERNLWGVIDLTKNIQGLHCLASNAITILNFAGKSLSGKDLSFVCIPQADLSESLCGNTNFSGADLRYVNFKDACLSCADFSGANLNFANFATSRTIPMPGSVGQVKCFQNIANKWYILAVCEVERRKFQVCAFSFDDFKIVQNFEFDGSTDRFHLDAFCSGNRNVIACSSKTLLKVWDFTYEKNKVLTEIHFSNGEFEQLRIHPDLSHVYAVEKGTIQRYNLKGEQKSTVEINSTTTVANSWTCESDYSAINKYLSVEIVQERLLVLSTGDSILSMLSPDLSVIGTSVTSRRSFCFMAVAAKKQWIFVADRAAGLVRIFDFNLIELGSISTGHTSAFIKLSCSNDGRFVSSIRDDSFSILDATTLQVLASFPEKIISCDFLPANTSVVISRGDAFIELRHDLSPDVRRKDAPRKMITMSVLSQDKLLCSIKHGTYRFINNIFDLNVHKDFKTFNVFVGKGRTHEFNYGDALYCYPYKNHSVVYVYYLENYTDNRTEYRIQWQNYCDETVPIRDTEIKDLHDKSKFAINAQYFAYSTKSAIKVRLTEKATDDDEYWNFTAGDVRHLALCLDSLWVCSFQNSQYAISSYNLPGKNPMVSYSIGGTDLIQLIPIDTSVFWCHKNGEFFKDGKSVDVISLECNIFTNHAFEHNGQELIAIATLASQKTLTVFDPVFSVNIGITRNVDNGRVVLVKVIRAGDKRIVNIPLWFTPSTLYLYNRSTCLYLVSLNSTLNSRVVVVEINVDTYSWRIVNTLGISTQLDTTDANFQYVYGMANDHIKGTPVISAVDGDEFVSRCELISPVLYSNKDLHFDAPILRQEGKATLVVNELFWVISAVQQQTQAVFDHVYLILEGIYHSRRFICKMHLIVSGQEGRVKAYSFGLHDQERVDEMRKSLKECGVSMQQWQIDKERGLRLIDNVLRSKQKKWKYSSGRTNCAAWARLQLEAIQIEIAKQWYNFIVHLPRDLCK